MFHKEEMGPVGQDQEPLFAEAYPDLADLLLQYKTLKAKGESLGSLYTHPGKSEYMRLRTSDDLKKFAADQGVNLANMYHDLNEQ